MTGGNIDSWCVGQDNLVEQMEQNTANKVLNANLWNLQAER